MITYLIKGDKEHSSDTSLLCELFSGESSTMTLATAAARNVQENLPFCILGATQVLPTIKLITVMDSGQGLLDRFLLIAPLCLRPTSEETIAASDAVNDFPFKDLAVAFETIQDSHLNNKQYHFHQEAEHQAEHPSTS